MCVRLSVSAEANCRCVMPSKLVVFSEAYPHHVRFIQLRDFSARTIRHKESDIKRHIDLVACLRNALAGIR